MGADRLTEQDTEDLARRWCDTLHCRKDGVLKERIALAEPWGLGLSLTQPGAKGAIGLRGALR